MTSSCHSICFCSLNLGTYKQDFHIQEAQGTSPSPAMCGKFCHGQDNFSSGQNKLSAPARA